jgi:hypothetical protein
MSCPYNIKNVFIAPVSPPNAASTYLPYIGFQLCIKNINTKLKPDFAEIYLCKLNKKYTITIPNTITYPSFLIVNPNPQLSESDYSKIKYINIKVYDKNKKILACKVQKIVPIFTQQTIGNITGNICNTTNIISGNDTSIIFTVNNLQLPVNNSTYCGCKFKNNIKYKIISFPLFLNNIQDCNFCKCENTNNTIVFTTPYIQQSMPYQISVNIQNLSCSEPPTECFWVAFIYLVVDDCITTVFQQIIFKVFCADC